ncbi:hypothetical protein RRF57_010513 [Xylaria bambusicola]|uniref:Uncharacterized protein n=1 Tax=Xylaria bambusicola TaxID=326684 RepID=A0AAN7ULD2_9PEZI
MSDIIWFLLLSETVSDFRFRDGPGSCAMFSWQLVNAGDGKAGGEAGGEAEDTENLKFSYEILWKATRLPLRGPKLM